MHPDAPWIDIVESGVAEPLDELVEAYKSTLKDILDKHAPLRKKVYHNSS